MKEEALVGAVVIFQLIVVAGMALVLIGRDLIRGWWETREIWRRLRRLRYGRKQDWTPREHPEIWK